MRFDYHLLHPCAAFQAATILVTMQVKDVHFALGN